MNALKTLWMILVSPTFLIFIFIPLSIIGLLIWRTRRRRKLVPSAIPPADRTAVIAESSAIAGLSVSMLVMLGMYRQYDGTPYAFTEMAPEGASADYWKLIGLWSLIIAVGIALAWFRKTISAVALLTVFFCGAGYYVNEGFAFSYKAHEREVRTTKLPLTITIKNNVVGADVWFNGVLLGKTPIVADLDDVMAKIPNWNDRENVPSEFTDHNSFLKSEHGSFRPLAWFHLSPATRVSIEDEREDDRAIYARVELNGQPLFARGSHLTQSGSRIFGQLRDSSVEIDAFLPRWLDDLEMLIHQARLSDYSVDSTWITAIESYGAEGWQQINRLAEKEPAWDRVLDQWARARYSLPKSIDEEIANRALEQIQTEADEKVSYHTSAIAGRAVELLIPQLDRYELLRAAQRRLDSFRSQPELAISHGFVRGQFQFGTYGQNNWKGPAKPSDLVLAHAIFRLDQRMDRRDESQDNLVERQITPALMRINQRQSMVFDAAGALGGSVFENYVLQHDCLATVTDETDFNDKISFVEVNRWLFTAAQIRSAAGKKFRKDNSGRLMEVAEQIVRKSHNFTHNWSGNQLDFLFLDPELGKRSLGFQFYRRFDHLVTPDQSDASQAPSLRWEYLQRLMPNATIPQFVSAYRPYCDHRCNKTPLTRLEPDFQFDVLTALIEESDKLIRDVKENSNLHQIRSANRSEFVSLRLQIACKKSSDALIDWIDNHERRSSAYYSVGQWIETDKLPLAHLTALASSSDPTLQELVLKSVAQQPSPARLKLQALLLRSAHDGVREKARNLVAQLEALSKKPFMSRFIPSQKTEAENAKGPPLADIQ